jgi:hypothetical protein
MVQAYCLKEGKHIEVKDPKYALNSKGRAVVHGTCPNPSCGVKVYKLLKSEEIPSDLKAKMAKKGGKRSLRTGGKSHKKSRGKKRSRSNSRKKSGYSHKKSHRKSKK